MRVGGVVRCALHDHLRRRGQAAEGRWVPCGERASHRLLHQLSAGIRQTTPRGAAPPTTLAAAAPIPITRHTASRRAIGLRATQVHHAPETHPVRSERQPRRSNGAGSPPISRTAPYLRGIGGTRKAGRLHLDPMGPRARKTPQRRMEALNDGTCDRRLKCVEICAPTASPWTRSRAAYVRQQDVFAARRLLPSKTPG